jgi:hypothetical protein
MCESNSRGSGFLAPVIGAMPKHRRQLDLGIERSGPHDFAVRSGTFVQRTASVHRIPRPTSVTIAIRPSPRAQDAGRSARDLPDVTRMRACDTLARRANQLVFRRAKEMDVNDPSPARGAKAAMRSRVFDAAQQDWRACTPAHSRDPLAGAHGDGEAPEAVISGLFA